MLTERKLTERELESREVVLRGLLDNKQNLVKKYGKDAEKVMYGIATKKAKSKVESMNKEKIKELIVQSLTKEAAVTSVEDVIDPADYGLIGAGYLAGFGKKHSLNADQLEELGRKIVKQLYKGDFKAAKAKFIKEDNDPSGADLEGDPNEYVVGEGHGLDQGDLDLLKQFVDSMGFDREPVDAKDFSKLKKILQFIIKSNILQDKTKDLSKGKVNEDVDTFEVDNAIGELGDIIRNIDDKADEAREIVRQVFPQELSRLDAYGAFNMTYSNNRYDVTLGRFVERLEEEGYEIEDGEVYVNEGKLNESPSSEELRMARQAVYRFMKYRQVEDDEAIRDLINALEVLKRTGVKGRLSEKDVDKKKKMKLPSGLVNYMDFTKSVAEKLTKRHKVGDFVDDFQKSDAKQFKGKSDKKKKEMAVAAYLAKQND